MSAWREALLDYADNRWREALDAADAIREARRLPAGAATTAWLDGIVGGRLGVRVELPGGRTVAGTPREIGALVARAAYAPRESTASAVLGVLAGAGRPMGGPEIAATAGLSRNTVHRCLASLAVAGRVTGSRRPGRRGFGWRITGEAPAPRAFPAGQQGEPR